MRKETRKKKQEKTNKKKEKKTKSFATSRLCEKMRHRFHKLAQILVPSLEKFTVKK